MYAGVPPIGSRIESPADADRRALTRPKSRRTTRPRLSTITFDGLMSRCRRPVAWRASTLQRLQGDLAALGEIAGAIDHTHRSRPEPREDLEPRVAAEVSVVHGVPLRKGAHHTESIQLCWKVATILPFRPREATNSSERPPGYEDCVNRRPIPANAFDKARQEALRICAMNSRLPRAVLFASAPELRSSLLLGVIGLLPLISSGCGPPS